MASETFTATDLCGRESPQTIDGSRFIDYLRGRGFTETVITEIYDELDEDGVSFVGEWEYRRA